MSLKSGPSPANSRSVARLVIPPPPGDPLTLDLDAITISPDGRRVAFVAGRATSRHIYVREIDQFDSTPLAGTEGANSPFFSPDGQWIGFFAGGKLKKILASGGSPQSITETSGTADSLGATWEAGDVILYTPVVGSGIWRVPAAGGTPIAITKPTETESSHLWPQLLPGGKTLLYSAVESRASVQVYVQSLETGQRRSLIKGARAHYLPSDHLV